MMFGNGCWPTVTCYGMNLIHRLQRIQNSAARVLLLIPKFDLIRTALFDLHWRPVKQRISFKTMLLTFKCLIGKEPLYLRDLVERYMDRYIVVYKRALFSYLLFLNHQFLSAFCYFHYDLYYELFTDKKLHDFEVNLITQWTARIVLSDYLGDYEPWPNHSILRY